METTPAVGVIDPELPFIVVIHPAPEIDVQVIGDDPPPAEVKKYPLVPAVVGRLKLYVPAAA